MARSGSAAGIGHEQEFEQMLIDGWASRLNEVHGVAADTFLKFDMQFAVWKTLQNPPRERHAHFFTDVFRQSKVCGTC